jgi:plasmid maintenance system killer protein
MNKLSCSPRIYKWVFLIAFLFVVSSKVSAQFYAVKINALELLTTTLNVEASIVIHNQWSLHLPVKVNLWELNAKSYRHVAIMPGIRYWVIDSYSRGWFIGVNAVAGGHNLTGLVGNTIDFFSSNYRYKGWLCGGGVSGGYSFPMAKRWNIELEAGVAGVYIYHDIYRESGNGRKIAYQKGFLPIPGKIGVNIVYLF